MEKMHCKIGLSRTNIYLRNNIVSLDLCQIHQGEELRCEKIRMKGTIFGYFFHFQKFKK